MDFLSGVQKLTLQIKQPDKLDKGEKRLAIISIYVATILDKIQQLFPCPSETSKLEGEENIHTGKKQLQSTDPISNT